MIHYHRLFEKKVKKLPRKVIDRLIERQEILEQNHQNPILKIHNLHGKYAGCKSINITGDIRVVYIEIKPDQYLFMDIDTHSELYS